MLTRRPVFARILTIGSILSIAWSTPAMSDAPATQIGRFHLDAPLPRVFPLFTALGERAWAAGWEPVILSGDAERGSAFRTLSHSGVETTWVVVDYRPTEGRVSYARLANGSNIGLVDVHCTKVPGHGTDVSVRYTLTPVTDAGRAFVTAFLDAAHYAEMMDEWRLQASAALERAASPN